MICFCHQEYQLREKEQEKEQEILFQVIQEHVEKMVTGSKLKNIFIVEMDAGISKQMASIVQSIDSGQLQTLMQMRVFVGP